MRTLERTLRVTSTSVLDTLFPPVCSGCGRRGHWVCEECRPTVPTLIDAICARCGALRSDRCVCADVPDSLLSIRSAFPFDGWVRKAIHSFKYEGERARDRHLGDLLLPLLPLGAKVEVVIPIPMHPTRMRERGFNQATLLAARLAASLDGVPVIEIERRGSVTPQVGLESAQRSANVAGAFLVSDPRKLAGLRVVLVDDVITTTATMTACAQAIADAGAASIRCLSVARAV